MRFGLLLLVLVSGVFGCSSDDTASAPAGANACIASGGVCAANFPFRCAPGYEPATDTRKTACGKSEGTDPIDVACCFPEATPPDTGVKDTGSVDAPADSSADSTADAPSDGTSD